MFSNELILLHIILTWRIRPCGMNLEVPGSQTLYFGCLQIIVISWILGIGIIGINVYYLTTAFVDWLIHNDLPKVGNVFIGIIVFPLMAIYVLAVIYLTFRKDTVMIHIEPEKNVDLAAQSRMESGVTKPDGSFQADVAPYRQDLADIPFPE